MVSPINETGNIFLNMLTGSGNTAQNTADTSLNSFEPEDKAIISSEAKMLNELDKFNSGQGNAVDLAVTSVTSKNQVEATVNVINTKNQMTDKVLETGE